jgi:orotate phosphoribosyltransferase
VALCSVLVCYARMQDQLMQLLAGRRGHFRMESGYHSDSWFELDRLFAEPERLRPFVSELARRLAAHRIDAVCGPMSGGAKLARMIADELNVACFVAERFESPEATGLFPVRYQLPPSVTEQARGRAFAIVDDGISAGSAVRGTLADVLACHGRPVVVGALLVFGDRAAQLAHENRLGLEAIARMSFGMWTPEQCPMCRAGIPVVSVSDAA